MVLFVMPTLSTFDGENQSSQQILDGTYPTLRYDTPTGLYAEFFEDLVYKYNNSEKLTLRAYLRPKDWLNMTPFTKIRYKGQLYRLMRIKNYDPVTNQPCRVELFKEI